MDDAYVEADKVGVSTDVSGIVKEVDVTENQHVELWPKSSTPLKTCRFGLLWTAPTHSWAWSAIP